MDDGMKEPNGFLNIKAELCRRTKKPVRQFTFWVYIVLSVVLLGGIGVWYEIGVLINSSDLDTSSLKMAFLTFSPAVIGASSLLIIFEKKQSREWIAFGVFCLIVTLFMFAILVAVNLFDGILGIFLSTLLAVFSVWLCWVANSENIGLQDSIDPSDSIGGDLDKALTGSTEKWEIK